MSEMRIKFFVIYIIALLTAYMLKKGIYRMATRAIKEEKLSSGIYRLFPVEGERAVGLANGYIRGVNIYFWFILIFFLLVFILGLIQGAI